MKIKEFKQSKAFQNAPLTSHQAKIFIKQSVRFLQKKLAQINANKAIVGLSGGIDSAVVALLCKMAFGENLLALALPSTNSSIINLDDAKKFAKEFDITLYECSLALYEQAYNTQHLNSSAMRVGNFCARVRMALLYDMANKYNGVVIGTSNKSELMLGYGTIFGDLACAFNPIGSLLKTDIFILAKALGVPQYIINKSPSADLYHNQTDEKEFGFSYSDIDMLLREICAIYGDFRNITKYEYIKKKAFIKRGFDELLVRMVVGKIKANLFKRKLAEIFIPRGLERFDVKKSPKKKIESNKKKSINSIRFDKLNKI